MKETLKDYINKFTLKYKNLSEEELLNQNCIDLSDLKIDYIHPKLFISKGYVNLNDNNIKKIPAGILECPMHLCHNSIEEIDYYFQQKNNLYLANNPLKRLPEDYHQKGDLDISDTQIEEVPSGYVQYSKRMFIFYNTPIKDIHHSVIMDKSVREEIRSSELYKTYQNRKNNKNYFINTIRESENDR